MKALLALLLFAAPATAIIAPPKEPDFRHRPLTRPEPPKEKQFTLTDDCEITIDGKPAKRSDLKPGMTIWYTVNDKGQVIRIRASTKEEEDNK